MFKHAYQGGDCVEIFDAKSTLTLFLKLNSSQSCQGAQLCQIIQEL